MESKSNEMLEEKLTEAHKTHYEIINERKTGGIKSKRLYELSDKRVQLETEIYEQLFNGGKLKDHVFDYCFRFFHGSSKKADEDYVYTTAFDKVPIVRKFYNKVKELKEEKILTLHGKVPSETGVISGPCKFELNDDHLITFYIPVHKLLSFDEDKEVWAQNSDSQKIIINSDIFRYPSSRDYISGSKVWRTDYSKEYANARKCPAEISVLLGNEHVSKAFENSVIQVIKNINVPNPYIAETLNK